MRSLYVHAIQNLFLCLQCIVLSCACSAMYPPVHAVQGPYMWMQCKVHFYACSLKPCRVFAVQCPLLSTTGIIGNVAVVDTPHSHTGCTTFNSHQPTRTNATHNAQSGELNQQRCPSILFPIMYRNGYLMTYMTQTFKIKTNHLHEKLVTYQCHSQCQPGSAP